MPISAGLYKKIHQWIMGEDGKTVAFRPFLTNGNPYKSRIFLISTNAVPFFKVEDRSEQIFAESLVNRDLFQELYFSEIKGAPREFKGSLQFEAWLKKQYNESLLYTSLNTYQLDSADHAKSAKKEGAANFERGKTIFKEVLEEFQPEIIILQGTAAFNQFKTLYADNLAIYNANELKVQVLEETGPFAEMDYGNGKKAYIFVARSMGSFGAEGKNFERFKGNLAKNILVNA
ncbi:RNA 2'-phosphotransferase [Solibacillus sp. FSL W8-0474]|uniref:RNA 2'-phosphotransferase n=1 Tax=Solibacillus sp. FSL W8-0474 TaxID=2975336 RepID=UPI0030FAE3C9